MDGRQPARLRADFADNTDWTRRSWLGGGGGDRGGRDPTEGGVLRGTYEPRSNALLQLAPYLARIEAPPPEPVLAPWQKVGGQVLAALGGAKDSLPLELGDRIPSVVFALGDIARGHDPRDAYGRRMLAEHERDAYDHAHYSTARALSKSAGVAAQLMLLGRAEGVVARGVRIPEATPLVSRELAVMGGAGGGAGIGSQAISDLANRKVSPLSSYAGSAAGGATSALTSVRGLAGVAGAIGGATSSVVQDLVSGRWPSLEKAANAARDSSYPGAIGGVAGRYFSNRLPRGPGGRTTQGFRDGTKQGVGEDLARIRTWAQGDRTEPGGQVRVRGGRTYPDHRSFRGSQERHIVEAKHGLYAALSPRQKEAYQSLYNYRVDHTMPQDIGVISGFMPGMYEYIKNINRNSEEPNSD